MARVQEIEQAENYFSNVPKKLRIGRVYAALLNCCAHRKSVEKAEATMQQMRDLGLAIKTMDYNCMLHVYYQTRNYEKLGCLIHKMEEKGISSNKYILGIRISAYAAASDSEGTDKTVIMMESDPSFVLDWAMVIVASGYAKAGFVDKALAMLKKSEALILGENAGRAYQFLLAKYVKCGKKDEVLRICQLYKERMKVYNKGYMCVVLFSAEI